MWIEIGHFAAIGAFLLALAQIGGALAGVFWNRPAWIRVGRHAAIGAFGLLTISCTGLIISFMTHDFSVRYVAGPAGFLSSHRHVGGA